MTTFLKTYFVVIIIDLLNQCKSAEFLPKHKEDPKLQVKISTGVLQGFKDQTVGKHETYYAFQGIPFAIPPLGPLRFSPPEPFPRWSGVLNATIERSMCVQNAVEMGTEDCLFVNVYTPQDITNLDSTKKMPVMVWIYGGAFANGYSNYSAYGPDYLLEHGIVFVSFNYRIGIFGFLSTEDLSSPGNYGLKDQLEALRWIQKNIEFFGGDAGRVTIFGESAGAASVSYLLLAPLARNLFHRAISESGSALCPWAIQREPKRIAIEVAFACGIFESDSKTLVNRLRGVDYKKLRSRASTTNYGTALEPLNGLPFSPCIEPVHEGAFITNRSSELFKNGQFNQVPYMIGFTSQEASIIQDIIGLTRPYIAHWDLMPTLLVPANMNIQSKTVKKEVANIIKAYYFGKKYIAMSTKTEMMNFLGDTQFVRSIMHCVHLCSNYTNTYLYIFSYEGYLGRYGTKKETSRKVKGAGHVEDLYYLFRRYNVTSPNDTDDEVRTNMTKLWTNFAKYGNPTPINETNSIYWPPINAGAKTLFYLNIDSTLDIRKDPRAEAMDFWDDLYKQYSSGPYDSY